MLKCGITGSTGVLGKKIVKTLPFKFYKFRKDITNLNEVNDWVGRHKFDLIIHLAAISAPYEVKKNNKKAINVNVIGTQNLVKSLLKKQAKPKWFFYSSSAHVYKLNKRLILSSEKDEAKPQNFYGKTKLNAEKYLIKNLKNTEISLCIGRIFSFTDKYQRPPFVIPSIIKKIVNKNSKKIEINNLNHYRDFLNTKTIIKIIYQLSKKKSKGIFNIASGKPIHLINVAQLVCEKYKKVFIIDKKLNVPTYLVADTKKISKVCNLYKRKFKNNLKYFY
jgi:nucleoside-diphosphate-sugar epimerase